MANLVGSRCYGGVNQTMGGALSRAFSRLSMFIVVSACFGVQSRQKAGACDSGLPGWWVVVTMAA